MEGIDINTVSDLRDGSHDAFERVFTAFFGRVKSFIFGYVKSEADAEELAEDVFVKLWTGRASLDPGRAFSPYLHTVARNAALNFLRHKFVRESHAGGIAAGGEAGSTSEEEMIARETALLVEMTVEKMPAQRRAIYRMSRGEGLRNDEIAERLSTTRRNVESQLSAALKEIRKAILAIFL